MPTATSDGGNVDEIVFVLDEEVVMLGIVGVEIGFRAFDGDLTEQADLGELVQRVVDGGERHRHLGVVGFLVQHFRRHMPVALGEQNPPQRHALPRRAQPDLAQLRLDVVPRTAVEIGKGGRRVRLDDRRRERGGTGNERTRLGHYHTFRPATGPSEIVASEISIRQPLPAATPKAITPPRRFCTVAHERGGRLCRGGLIC